MGLNEQIEKEQKLACYNGEDAVASARIVLEQYRKDHPQGIAYKTGLPTLDKIIGGIYPGQLVVISGITGQGKTTLAQTISFSLAEQLVRPLWLSYEMPVDDFLRAFNNNALDYIYMPMKLKDNTLEWIENRLIESKLKYSTHAIFIDHIHYLINMSPKSNISFIIGETVRGLKQIAIKHRVVVILIAHMQKTKPDEEPGLGLIRDSSFIEQEADCVVYVWRFADDKAVTVLKVVKNRRRGVIDERIPLVLKGGRYYEKAN